VSRNVPDSASTNSCEPEDFTLHAGDSVYFPADTMHRYANPGSVPCVYYVAALIMRPRGNRPRPDSS
jgi:mannose-6-phosphate isomerase-like protein (cupin superfamily)